MTIGRAGASTLDPESFRAIADFAYRESGLTLVEEKAAMIQSRLRHRLKALGIVDFSDYCTLLLSERGREERRHLISALTTNVSHFFRENHHFGILKQQVDRRLADLRAGGKMRIWSAGCSNGQEALSSAMTILEHVPEAGTLDIRILGTDIDPNVVGFARAGIYPDRLMNGVPPELRHKYFRPAESAGGESCYAAAAALRGMIRYNELNLLNEWPIRTHFDVIFCRNVVIYFDTGTQVRLWPRFHKVLRPDGVLFLGHSERITDPATFGFACTDATTYRPLSALN